MKETKQLLQMDTVRGASVRMHVDDDGVWILDECEGIDPEDAASLFPEWALEAARENQK